MKQEIQVYWVRRGKEGFLISKVYMNKENAELVCKGHNLQQDGTFFDEYNVIPLTITIN